MMPNSHRTVADRTPNHRRNRQACKGTDLPSRPDRRPPIAFSAGTSLTMLVAFLLMALTGGGCTVLGPDYQRPELDLPTGYRHAPATPADGQAADQLAPLQQAVPADDLPKGAWWEIYRDPMLDDLQAQAAAGNRELRVALARLEQARAATGLAEAELLPRLDLQPSGQRGRTPEALSPLGVAATATNLNLPLNLGYELDLWGRLRRQSEAAGADFAASAAEVENFRLLLHGEVARTYFNLRVTEHEQQLLARTVELRRDNLRLTESRYRNGLTSRLDVSRSQTELAVSEAELIALEQRRNELEHALALLLGETTVSVQQCRTFGRSARLEYSGYEAPGCLPESAALLSAYVPLNQQIGAPGERLPRQRGLKVEPAETVRAIPGRGMVAETAAGEVLAGSRDLLTEHGIKISPPQQSGHAADKLSSPPSCSDDEVLETGLTEVHVAVAGRYLGLIQLEDSLRPEAPALVEQLRRRNLQLLLLSGDHAGACVRVAAALGIETVHSGIDPAGKKALVESLQAGGGRVLMVGDGINDAPALAAADIGCVLAGGTDIAVSTADLVLTRDRLSDLAPALATARRSLRIIRENLFWAFTYNLVTLPLAVSGLLAPIHAAAAMAVSSVLVVANSLRLAR